MPGAAARRTSGEGAATVAEPAALEGERKTVTALFADIKGSTELEQDLDPEEARAIVDPALKLMIDAVRRYDGYVVQSTGDGIFALFGAPVAHEDHPQRALYTALKMQDDVRRYADKLRAEGRSPLQIRIGADTGEVVVRTIETGGKTEYSPIGHAANLASRMQALANPGSTVISESTRKLVEGYFTLKALGASRVKGIAEPVPVYEVTGLGPLRTRLQRAAGRGLTKFVGRERELDALDRAATLVKSGRGQIVAAMAEAGAGKSRLFFEFKAKNQSGWMVLEAFSVSHGKASAYLPVLDLLQSYFKIASEDDARTRREKVTGRVLALDRSLEDTLPYLFGLLGIVEGEDPLAQMDVNIHKRRTLDAIKRILSRESLNEPLMVIFEDLHWIDEQTQELLNLLSDSIANARVLLLVNYRPEYAHQWGGKTYYTQLRLDPLGKGSADEMLSALLGDNAELTPLKRVIVERTEGNPFFMEETVQVLLDEGALVRNGTIRLMKPISELKIPPTVQGILAARIDRLPEDDKQLLQTVAVIGKEFPLRLTAEIVRKNEESLAPALDRLLNREFIQEQPSAGDVVYEFKHALTQEVAYNSLLIERRRSLHERIGDSMERLYAETPDEHLLELAHHFSRGANAAKAVHYLTLAARQSLRRSSPTEAANFVGRGLTFVSLLPTDTRKNAELSLLAAKILSLVEAQGYAAPELESVLSRAMDLATEVGTPRQRVQILTRLLYYHAWKAQWAQNFDVGQRILAIGSEANSIEMIGEAHVGLFDHDRMTGNLSEARRHADAVSNLAASSSPQAAIDSKFWMGRAHWCDAVLSWDMGYPDRAKRSALQALDVIRSYRDARQLAQLLNNCHPIFALSGDTPASRRMAEEAVEVSERCGFRTQLAWATFNLGCTVALEGSAEQGIDKMTAGMAAHEAEGNQIKTWMLGPLGGAYLAAARAHDGLETVEKAIGFAARTGENLWLPELLRLRGELVLLDAGDLVAAQDCFNQAIALARRQTAKMWELRASTSLARLLVRQQKNDEAKALLGPIVGWFTEGAATADIRDARLVLASL